MMGDNYECFFICLNDTMFIIILDRAKFPQTRSCGQLKSVKSQSEHNKHHFNDFIPL